jgi:hypothetical protein
MITQLVHRAFGESVFVEAAPKPKMAGPEGVVGSNPRQRASHLFPSGASELSRWRGGRSRVLMPRQHRQR